MLNKIRARWSSDRAAAGSGRVHAAALVVTTGLLLPWLIRLDPLRAALCLAQIAITVTGIVWHAYPVLRPIGLVTFVFSFSWLCVAPIYQLSHDAAAWNDAAVLESPHAVPGLALMTTASAAMLIGFRLGSRGRPSPAAGEERTTAAPSRIMAAIYIVSCLVIAPWVLKVNGGLGAMFGDRTTRNETLAANGVDRVLDDLGRVGQSLDDGGAKLALAGIVPSALATAAAYILLTRVYRQFRSSGLRGVSTPDAVLCGVALALAVVFSNPFTNARAQSVAAFGSLLIILLQPRSRRAGVWMTVAALFATLVVYPLGNALRGNGSAATPGFSAFSTPDFDGLQQFINTVAFVDDEGHGWGIHVISALFYVVPRTLWADKARPASWEVAEHRGYDFINLSLPLGAELYLDLTLVGMVVVLLAVTFLAGRCDRAWLHAPYSRMAFLVPYLCIACLMVIRGPLGSAAPIVLTPLVLIFLGSGAIRLRRPPGSSGTEADSPSRRYGSLQTWRRSLASR